MDRGGRSGRWNTHRFRKPAFVHHLELVQSDPIVSDCPVRNSEQRPLRGESRQPHDHEEVLRARRRASGKSGTGHNCRHSVLFSITAVALVTGVPSSCPRCPLCSLLSATPFSVCLMVATATSRGLAKQTSSKEFPASGQTWQRHSLSLDLMAQGWCADRWCGG